MTNTNTNTNTEDTMIPLDDQTAFDRMVQHCFDQGFRSEAKDTCMYRMDNGARCAVGCLIPDEQYRKDFEGKSAAHVANEVPVLSEVDWDLLESMQTAHDFRMPPLGERGTSPRQFLLEALKIAKNYHLSGSLPRRLLMSLDGGAA